MLQLHNSPDDFKNLSKKYKKKPTNNKQQQRALEVTTKAKYLH